MPKAEVVEALKLRFAGREFALGVEIAGDELSLPLYSLAAIEKNRPESPEGALKIYLFGSVSSAALLLGIGLLFAATGTRFGAAMALFFFVAYLFSNVGAFLCVAALETAGEEPTLRGARNLIRRSPSLAAAFLVFLLSLGGIPFALGFWGKMYVFLAAGRAEMWGLVFLGAVLAVVALYYYLNVARWMLIVSDDGPKVTVPVALWIAIVACVVLVVGGGMIPRLFIEPAVRAVAGF